MTSNENSKNMKLNDYQKTILEKRYFFNNENWEGLSRRVASLMSIVENKKNLYEEKFAEMIFNMNFLPGGRILRNSGRPRGSLFNCYHLPIGDSREEIGQFLKDALILWGEGGGVGVNFSNLRPKGSPIQGVGGESSGVISFIKAANAVAETIESGGQRRAAALAALDVSHPEILDFINAKIKDKIISSFNISVQVNSEFIEAIESNKEWEFKFKQKSFGKMPARDIWNNIVTNMVKCGEPGLINTTNMFKNNSYYYDPVTGTNPCGETCLAPHDSCDLGSLNLPNFITGTRNTNWKKLEEIIKLGVRFLDNVIEVNKYSLNECSVKAQNSRRIGLGVMGLAEYLFLKKIRYGSKESIQEAEKLFRFIRDTIYESSIELSIEKGAFPKFDHVQYGKASFIRKLPAQLRASIKKFGVRNVTSIAIAPTGTISQLANVSSGIEPLVSKVYLKSDRVGDRLIAHPMFLEYKKKGEEIPDWFVDIHDLKPEDHFDIQAIVQKYVDNSVSKTINMPADTTVDQVDKLLLEYIHDLKGVTIYVDKSRGEQVNYYLTKEQINDYLKGKIEVMDIVDTVKCSTGSCDI